jgi:endonuclease I
MVQDKNDNNGNYISDIYCHKRFGASAGVGPNVIPDGTKINCEHTWPQSKFTKSYPNEMQKSDLHHLYPADSKANSIRGNDDFADVSNDSGKLTNISCNISKFGSSVTSSTDGFEPPLTHKGNVARALFYFSVRYKISIPKNEEDVLRRWDELDPVDQEEYDRNEAIEQVQDNRNPFIDFPGLANDINKF